MSARPYTLKFLACLVLAGAAQCPGAIALAQPQPAFTAKQKELLKERGRLEVAARKFQAAGKLADALATAEKVLAVERQVYGDSHVEIAASLQWIAQLHTALEDFATARRVADEALAMRLRLHGKSHWQTTDARLARDYFAELAELKSPQRVALKDADRLMSQASTALDAAKFQEGLDHAVKALQVRQQILGETHRHAADSAFLAGFLAALANAPAKARTYSEQALAVRQKILGEHPDTAMAAYNLGFVRNHQGDFAGAIAPLDEAFITYKKTLGWKHADTLATADSLQAALKKLGQAHLAREDFPAALRAMDSVLAIYLDLHGDNHWQTREARLAIREIDLLAKLPAQQRASLADADKLTKQARAAEQGEKFAEAINAARKAADIRRRILGAEDRGANADLSWAAECADKAGEFAIARQLSEEALTVWKKVLGDHPDTANELNSLGIVFRKLGDFRKARSLFEQAVAMNRKVRGEVNAHTAASLNNLGGVLLAQGEHADARPILEQAVAICRTVHGSQHADTATALNNLGLVLQSQADYAGAKDSYFEALRIQQRILGKHAATAVTLNNIGGLLEARGDLAGARKYCDQALEIHEHLKEKKDDQFGVMLNNVGSLLHGLGEHKEARRRYEQALAVYATTLGEEHPTVATITGNIGELLRDQGAFREALDYHERALAINKKNRPRHLLTANSYRATAIMLHMLGKRSEALTQMNVGLSIEQANLGESFQFVSERAMFNGLDRVGYALPVLLTITSDCSEKADIATAFAWTLRRKGIVFESVLRFRQAQNVLARDEVLAEKVARFHSLHNLLNNTAINPPPGWSAAKLLAQQSTWQKEAEPLEAELKAALSRKLPGQLDDWQGVNADKIRAKLPAGAALVEYVRWQPYDFKATGKAPRWRPARYLAFVLTPNADRPHMIDLGEAKAIDDAITNLREHLERAPDPNASIKAYWPEAKTLHKLVFAPLQPTFDNARTIYLAADGLLNQVPFEALVDEKGKFLIEDFQFAYQTSGRDLLRPNADLAKGVVVFAGPDFDLDSAKGKSRVGKQATRAGAWKSLKGAAAEAGDIRKVLDGSRFGPVRTFEGADALEESLKTLPAPRLLHLATHGYYFDREAEVLADSLRTDLDVKARLKKANNPLLRSGIVLAGANAIGDKTIASADVEDGWVTAAEIGLLNLRGTELVVLSACQTGLGDVKTGEGVFGLRRAFLHAGARTLVTSLFSVPDADTRVLMQQFYGNLKAGRSKLDALHGAQLNIIRNGRQKAGEPPHPFFWAGFFLVGDPS